MATSPQNPPPSNNIPLAPNLANASPGSTATALQLLQSINNSLVQATVSLDSVTGIIRQNSTNQSQFIRIVSHLIVKFTDGLAIGVVFLAASLLDTSGVFSRFIAENFTQMPLIVVVGGVLAGYAYRLTPNRPNKLSNICKAWLELVQQFFTVGIGAFWLIKSGLYLREIVRPAVIHIEWTWGPYNFIILLMGALLAGAMYELRDEPLDPPIKWLGIFTLTGSLIFFIMLALSVDGGKRFESKMEFLVAKQLKVVTVWFQ